MIAKENKKFLLRQLLHCLIGDELERQAAVLVKKHCNGCIIDHPSQMQHMCLFAGPDDPWYELIYEKAVRELDLLYVQAVFLESANTRNLDGCQIDFDSCAADSLAKWEKKTFREDSRVSGGQYILHVFRTQKHWIGDKYTEGQIECTEEEMVEWARQKVDRLELRFRQ